MQATQEKVHHAIADWLGDIVALESHVEEAMDKQLKLPSDEAEVTAAITQFHDTVRESKQRAVTYQEQYGSTAGSPIKKIGSSLLGKAAGVIDMLRQDSVAKALRDDYTAYNLLAISYTMLHTTAMAMQDKPTQAFAEMGLRTYAAMVQDINRLIPLVVVSDLKDNADSPVIKPNVVTQCRKLIDAVWKSTTN
jgi:ferritin-like metal-binding protein YciE